MNCFADICVGRDALIPPMNSAALRRLVGKPPYIGVIRVVSGDETSPLHIIVDYETKTRRRSNLRILVSDVIYNHIQMLNFNFTKTADIKFR